MNTYNDENTLDAITKLLWGMKTKRRFKRGEIAKAWFISYIAHHQYDKVLLSDNDINYMTTKIRNDLDLREHKRYMNFFSWLQRYHVMGEAYYKQVQLGFYRLYAKVSHALYVEQRMPILNRLPVVITKDAYIKRRQQFFSEQLSKTMSYYDVIFFALKHAIINNKHFINYHDKADIEALCDQYYDAKSNLVLERKQISKLKNKYSALFCALRDDIAKQKGADFCIKEADYKKPIIRYRKLYDINLYGYRKLFEQSVNEFLFPSGVSILEEGTYDNSLIQQEGEFKGYLENYAQDILYNSSFLSRIHDQKEINLISGLQDALVEGLIGLLAYNKTIELVRDLLKIPQASLLLINIDYMHAAIDHQNNVIDELINSVRSNDKNKEQKLDFIKQHLHKIFVHELGPTKEAIKKTRPLVIGLDILGITSTLKRALI